MRIITFFFMIGLGVALQRSSRPQELADSKATAHIQKIIQSLPPDSLVRADLQAGIHGDGIHYSWMDDMHQAGIRRARVILNFVWDGRPTEIRLNRILYFDKYDTDCAQITDAERLNKFALSGLGKKLEEFAVQQTAGTPWRNVNKNSLGKPGMSSIELMDDEWIQRFPPGFKDATLSPLPWTSLLSALESDEESKVVELLATGQIDSEKLDSALMQSSYRRDSCITRQLLKAGANANTRNSDGATPLMNVAQAGSLHQVQVLLDAGADVNARDAKGDTALSLAQKEGKAQVVQLLQHAGLRSFTQNNR